MTEQRALIAILILMAILGLFCLLMYFIFNGGKDFLVPGVALVLSSIGIYLIKKPKFFDEKEE